MDQVAIALPFCEYAVGRRESNGGHTALLQGEITVGDVARGNELNVFIDAGRLERFKNLIKLRAPVAADADHLATQIFDALNRFLHKNPEVRLLIDVQYHLERRAIDCCAHRRTARGGEIDAAGYERGDAGVGAHDDDLRAQALARQETFFGGKVHRPRRQARRRRCDADPLLGADQMNL